MNSYLLFQLGIECLLRALRRCLDRDHVVLRGGIIRRSIAIVHGFLLTGDRMIQLCRARSSLHSLVKTL